MLYRLPLLLLAILIAAPAAAAALNGVTQYDGEVPFLALRADGIERLELFSGALDASLTGQQASYAFQETDGFVIEGPDRVCWQRASGVPTCAPGSGPFSVHVLPGGSAAFDLKQTHDGHVMAGHAQLVLADLRDLSPEIDLPDQGALVVMVNGTVDLGGLDAIPSTGELPDADRTGGLSSLTEGTRIEIRDGSGVLHGVRGSEELVIFEGPVEVPAFRAKAALLPFQDGASATLTPATDAEAQEGIRLGRLQEAIDAFQGAEGASGPPGGQDIPALMRPMLNGALLGVNVAGEGESSGLDLKAITLVRFETMELASHEGSATTSAVSPLTVEDGEVAGASDLVGIAWFAFPWWSYVLWGAGILLFVLRIVTKSPRKDKKWDRFTWVGRLAGIGAFLLAFFLWDLEFRHVLGFSMLQAGNADTVLLVLAGIQFALFGLVMFATAAPLGLVMENMLRLGRLGTFHGLAKPIATLLGFVMGAQLLPAYMQYVLSRVPTG